MAWKFGASVKTDKTAAKKIWEMVARGGIEPPTRGFSVRMV
jgi:hypothetical protein